jgi:hypothetical protein
MKEKIEDKVDGIGRREVNGSPRGNIRSYSVENSLWKRVWALSAQW